jgi:NAD(P)-dependent dehydrogenase (short-subunit alcohol dehydrogenase family)
MSDSRRVALITGASRGLGEVIAGVLARRGYTLVLNARSAGPLQQAADSLSTYGSHVVAVAGDVTDATARTRMVTAARELGGLDILVNNASELGVIGPLLDFDVTRFARIFPVNAGAPLALIQLAAPLLAARRGLVVNITSDAASGAYPGWGPYGASKAALELITRTLASELKPAGISAVLVDPGDMRTRMHQQAYPLEDISDRPLPDVTIPFWNWLFDQDPQAINGEHFAAQRGDARWQTPAA